MTGRALETLGMPSPVHSRNNATDDGRVTPCTEDAGTRLLDRTHIGLGDRLLFVWHHKCRYGRHIDGDRHKIVFKVGDSRKNDAGYRWRCNFSFLRGYRCNRYLGYRRVCIRSQRRWDAARNISLIGRVASGINTVGSHNDGIRICDRAA